MPETSIVAVLESVTRDRPVVELCGDNKPDRYVRFDMALSVSEAQAITHHYDCRGRMAIMHYDGTAVVVGDEIRMVLGGSHGSLDMGRLVNALKRELQGSQEQQEY